MSDEKLEIVTEQLQPSDQEQERKRRGILSQRLLLLENAMFAGTAGVSHHNRDAGFAPAYLDSHTGLVVLSRFGDGSPAPVHVLDGLPEAWVASRTADGRVVTIREGIVAGFVRDGRFYTRDEAVETLRH